MKGAKLAMLGAAVSQGLIVMVPPLVPTQACHAIGCQLHTWCILKIIFCPTTEYGSNCAASTNPLLRAVYCILFVLQVVPAHETLATSVQWALTLQAAPQSLAGLVALASAARKAPSIPVPATPQMLAQQAQSLTAASQHIPLSRTASASPDTGQQQAVASVGCALLERTRMVAIWRTASRAPSDTGVARVLRALRRASCLLMHVPSASMHLQMQCHPRSAVATKGLEVRRCWPGVAGRLSTHACSLSYAPQFA